MQGQFARVLIAIFVAALVGNYGCNHGFAGTDLPSEYGDELTEDQIPWDEWAENMARGFAALEKIEIENDWFDVYQVVPGVRSIHEPGHWEMVISYLIEGSESAILFDSGLGIATIKAVTDRLTAKPITVVSSHSHYDHGGGTHLYSDIWAPVTEFTRKNARGTPNRIAKEFVPEESFTREPPAEFNRSTYSIKPWTLTRELRDGEVIDLGNRKIEVLYVPGHAPDSIALLDRRNRVLFTGDTLNLGPIYAMLDESNLYDFHQSAGRLAALEGDVDWIFPAHSPPTRDTKLLSRFHDSFSRIHAGTASKREHTDMEPWGRISVYRNEWFWIMTRLDAPESD